MHWTQIKFKRYFSKKSICLHMNFLAVVVLLFLGSVPCEGANILFLAPLSSKSHKNFFMGIIKALTKRDHKVTLLSPYASPKQGVRNIREVVISDFEIDKFLPNYFESDSTQTMLDMFYKMPRICSDSLSSNESQSLFQEKYDLVMISCFFSECYLSLVHKMQLPLILVSPAGLVGPMHSNIGNPMFPSFVSNILLEATSPLGFMERLINTLSDVALNNLFNYIYSRIDSECRSRGLCPADMPHVTELLRNSSMMFVNSIKELEVPARPYVPAVIHVGGIHCQPAKPLPKDLEEWVQGSGEEGFIFFSLGSAVRPSDLPDKWRLILLRVFGSLKQRVLFKWNLDKMDEVPPNVRLGKWFPQQDILAHPKLRLFITHGGLLSTMESIYHNTPVLGLPVFGDQLNNMRIIRNEGWGKSIDWEELDEETLRSTIMELISDKRLLEIVQKKSRVMKDVIQHPADVAAYWTEYVIRHKGAPHLKSPLVYMPWYEVYNVDVWFTVAVSSLLLIALFVGTIWLLFRCCWRCLKRNLAKEKKE